MESNGTRQDLHNRLAKADIYRFTYNYASILGKGNQSLCQLPIYPANETTHASCYEYYLAFSRA